MQSIKITLHKQGNSQWILMKMLSTHSEAVSRSNNKNLQIIGGKNEYINGCIEKLQCHLKHSVDIKGSNADNSHGPHQRISCQSIGSAQPNNFTMPNRRLRLQRCNYCNVTYRDPRHITRTLHNYYNCLRVLRRDTLNTYKAAQKHEQQNSGHVCVSKTATEPRALFRSRIT